MSFLIGLLKFLQYEVTEPKSFGIYHILCLLTVVTVTVLLCVKCKDVSDKTLRKMLVCAWLILVFTEVYKQFVFSFTVSGEEISFDYLWYSFPFQFCSMPLYVFPLAAFLKDGKLREGVMSFISTYLLFAGLAVMIYPGDVYMYMLGINLQTMIHHGVQVIFGVLLLVYNRRKRGFVRFLGGMAVFAVCVATALVINISAYHILTAHAMDDTFNMFFISPYFDCSLPVLSMIQPQVAYPVFLLVYILGFSFAALLVKLIFEGILILVNRRKQYAAQ